MGIKGIYKEIGPGQRVSLCKLAVDTLENTGRPLRLAIDISIWQFQVQAAKGGSNPAIRTLFYRLVRLLGLAIHPIFVFDGPNKPAFKRNKRSSGRGDMVATAMAKRMIRLFGFTIHDAPGEAEAECALLEQKGVVDAVLSEDVDTIMFGCRRTLRNWSAEGTKGSKTPTHVSMYDAAAVTAGPSGLDREGMVLVALMSGGDYLPEGVPGCGVKVACEAAKAGFGRDLCRLRRADTDALATWKARLLHELRTNESGFFRTRHKALEIPESFPNLEILRYYTHPVVSREETVQRLKRDFPPTSAVNIAGVREFTIETFDWQFKSGATHLIRALAPSLLVQRFLERSESPGSQHDDVELKQREESTLVKAVSCRRAHFSTDATPELRISFVPADIVTLDLSKEPEEEAEAFSRSGIALNSDDEFDEGAAEEVGGEQPKSSSVGKPFDPCQPQLTWVPETIAKLGVPLAVEDWEGKQRLKEQRVAAKGTRKPRAKKTDMPAGALDRFFTSTKIVASTTTTKETPPVELAQSPARTNSLMKPPAPKGRSKQPKTSTSSQAKPQADVNPWTLASSQASPRVNRSLPPPASQAQPKPSSAREPILISSSPVAPPSPATDGPVLRSSQTTTPTRTKRASPEVENTSSPASLFGPSSKLRKQLLPVSEEPVRAEPQPTGKARPFKRVKSGAGGPPKTSTIQRSIKDLGRVTKRANPSQTATASTKASTQPIQISSDDDDDDDEFPDLFTRPPASAPPLFGQKVAPSREEGFDVLDANEDDDPFASPPRSLPRQTPPARFASTPAAADIMTPPTQDKSGRSQGQSSGLDTDTVERDPAHTITAAAATTTTTSTKTTTAPSKTTKLYIPRTSLTGLGFFTELEVDRIEADEVLAAHNSSAPAPAPTKGSRGAGGSRRAWRLSEIEVLDLTGEDY